MTRFVQAYVIRAGPSGRQADRVGTAAEGKGGTGDTSRDGAQAAGICMRMMNVSSEGCVQLAGMHAVVHATWCTVKHIVMLPVQKAALLRGLQLRSKHANVSLQLAQMRSMVAESGSVSTSASETCRSVQHAYCPTKVQTSAWSHAPAHAHACMQQWTWPCPCAHAGLKSVAAGCKRVCRRCRLHSRGSGR